EPAGLIECAQLALVLREELERRRLDTMIKTTGSLGLHLFAFDAVDAFASARALGQELAGWLADAEAELVATCRSPVDRRGKEALDWLWNDLARSTIAPYSVRGTPIPRVSAAVGWDEVAEAADGRAAALRFGPRDVLDRVAISGDLFRNESLA